MRRGRRGNMVLEAVMWIPILLLLVVGMVQFGKLTYVYYTLKKNLYTAGRYLTVQQGVNFCDTADATIQAALAYAATGTTDGSGSPLIPDFTADMIQVQPECLDPNTGVLGDCVMSGCDGAAGGPTPDYVVLSVPNGYQFPIRIPYLLLDPIPLKPQIRLPFGGT